MGGGNAMQTCERIQAVINTLNQITVSGYDNMNKLLGSMQTLTQIKNELSKGDDKKAPAEKGEKA